MKISNCWKNAGNRVIVSSMPTSPRKQLEAVCLTYLYPQVRAPYEHFWLKLIVRLHPPGITNSIFRGWMGDVNQYALLTAAPHSAVDRVTLKHLHSEKEPTAPAPRPSEILYMSVTEWAACFYI
jgi:hypothetical protein